MHIDLLRPYFSTYILILGSALILYSIIELIFPDRIYSLQKKWINHRFFSLHGLLLIAGGLPLTFFRETLPGKLMLAVGVFVVLTGPFIILYPSKIRTIFKKTEDEMEGKNRNLLYFDAIARLLSGILFIYTMIQYRSE